MRSSVTELIASLREGDRTALDQLLPLVYGELHQIAAGYLRSEHSAPTLQPTALVHEAYLRLIGAEHPDYRNRAHFFGVAASIMRQVLVDHARRRHAMKRGGYTVTVALDEARDSPASLPIVALDDALTSLAAIDKHKARLVELRFFGGMNAEEISTFLSTSVHRVRHDMRLALAWLHREVHR